MKYAIYGNSSLVSSADARAARAYCDGWGRQVGLGVVEDNPFSAGDEAENSIAWIAGFDDAEAGTIDISETHCSLPAFKVVPNIVALDAVDADIAILAAGLTVGDVTNSTDPVTAQAIAAGTPVNRLTALDYTLTA